MLVPKSALSIRKICDLDSSRYALGGAKFTRDSEGAPLAIATDGRRLVALSWNDPDADSFPPRETNGYNDGVLIPAETLAAADKIKPRKGDPGYTAITAAPDYGSRGTIAIAQTSELGSVSSEVKQLEGRFPRWADVFPSVNSDTSHVRLDARLLREMLELAEKHCGDEESRGVVISFHGKPDEAHKHGVSITACNEGGAKFHGVIMPLGFGKPNEDPPPALAWHACGGSLRADTAEEVAERMAAIDKMADEVAAPAPQAASEVAAPEVAAVVAPEPEPEPAPAAPAAVPAPVTQWGEPIPAKFAATAATPPAAEVSPATPPAPAREPRQPRAPRENKNDWRANARRILCGV